MWFMIKKIVIHVQKMLFIILIKWCKCSTFIFYTQMNNLNRRTMPQWSVVMCIFAESASCQLFIVDYHHLKLCDCRNRLQMTAVKILRIWTFRKCPWRYVWSNGEWWTVVRSWKFSLICTVKDDDPKGFSLVEFQNNLEKLKCRTKRRIHSRSVFK